VWVDLGAVFRIDRPRRVVPDGMDLQATVPGLLSLWSMTTTGHWVGYVSFTIRKADAGAAVTQWVLADALRPRSDLPAGQISGNRSRLPSGNGEVARARIFRAVAG
jgi:hypothetical protein